MNLMSNETLKHKKEMKNFSLQEKKNLTVSQTRNFRLFQTERVCRQQFRIG